MITTYKYIYPNFELSRLPYKYGNLNVIEEAM